MAMQAAHASCWALLILAAVGSTANAAIISQLDVCNRHTSSSMPSMSLSVSTSGVCTLASRMIAADKGSCPTSSKDPALVFKFPCTPTARPAAASGPSLNLWSSVTGPAPGTNNKTPGTKNLCDISTLHPTLYFHRVPPTYSFGYHVSGLPCSVEPATAAVLPASSSSAYALSYGLWLIPSLPAPPKAYSKQAQSCKLAVLLSDKAYVSRDSYSCSLLEWSKERTAALGRGCCTNAAV